MPQPGAAGRRPRQVQQQVDENSTGVASAGARTYCFRSSNLPACNRFGSSSCCMPGSVLASRTHGAWNVPAGRWKGRLRSPHDSLQTQMNDNVVHLQAPAAAAASHAKPSLAERAILISDEREGPDERELIDVIDAGGSGHSAGIAGVWDERLGAFRPAADSEAKQPYNSTPGKEEGEDPSAAAPAARLPKQQAGQQAAAAAPATAAAAVGAGDSWQQAAAMQGGKQPAAARHSGKQQQPLSPGANGRAQPSAEEADAALPADLADADNDVAPDAEPDAEVWDMADAPDTAAVPASGKAAAPAAGKAAAASGTAAAAASGKAAAPTAGKAAAAASGEAAAPATGKAASSAPAAAASSQSPALPATEPQSVPQQAAEQRAPAASTGASINAASSNAAGSADSTAPSQDSAAAKAAVYLGSLSQLKSSVRKGVALSPYTCAVQPRLQCLVPVR